MKHQFEGFIDDLKATHGENLASVILYGSAAAGDFIPQQSNYDLLIALHRIAPEDLRNAHATVREWVKMGHPVPVYFTVSELNDAADVFPIEFHRMETARKVLFGNDVLAGMKISDENLRHQTEYELRSKLIRLRRKYIPASGSADSLTGLMAESISSFAALFGAVLILRGIEPPATRQAIIARTVEHLHVDGTIFEKILNIRGNNVAEAMNEASANRLFGEYLEQIEKVIDSVDKAGTS